MLRALWGATVPYFKVIRPLNLTLAATGVLVGGVMTESGWTVATWPGLWLAMASVVLLTAGENALNDVFDLEIDRINRPDRPLPSGQLSVREAWMTSGIATTFGVLLAIPISIWHLTIALTSAILLLAYSAWLKRMPLVGNLVVSMVVGLSLIYGALVTGTVGEAWIGAVFAFLTTLAREIVKDVEDRVGDAAGEARTLALVLGPAPACRIGALVILATLVLTPLPFLFFGYGPGYLLIVGLANAALLAALWRALNLRAHEAGTWLKGAMVMGLAALAVG